MLLLIANKKPILVNQKKEPISFTIANNWLFEIFTGSNYQQTSLHETEFPRVAQRPVSINADDEAQVSGENNISNNN